MEALDGLTVMDTSEVAFTERVVAPLTVPRVALMLVVPAPTPVATPDALIVANPRPLDAQVTEAVRSCVLLSVNVPLAVNACVVPSGMEVLTGFTAIESKAAGATVKVVSPLMLPAVAVIVLAPVLTPIASPCDPAPFPILATAPPPHLHVTEQLTS